MVVEMVSVAIITVEIMYSIETITATVMTQVGRGTGHLKEERYSNLPMVTTCRHLNVVSVDSITVTMMAVIVKGTGEKCNNLPMAIISQRRNVVLVDSTGDSSNSRISVTTTGGLNAGMYSRTGTT